MPIDVIVAHKNKVYSIGFEQRNNVLDKVFPLRFSTHRARVRWMVQHDDFPAARLGRQLGLQPFVLFRTRCIVDIGVKAINVRNTVSKVVPRLVVGQVKVVVVQLSARGCLNRTQALR